MIHWYCRIAQRQGAVRPGMKASWNILSFFLPYGTSRRDSLSWVYGSNTGCNAGIFISAVIAQLIEQLPCKQRVAGLSPANGSNTYPAGRRSFRSTQAWQHKRAWIRERDMHLCRWCLTLGRLSYTNLSVHHIEPLHEAWGERLDDSNLITLCSPCHEQAEAGKISRAALHELTHTPPQLSPRPRRDKF